ncbi:MAG: PEP-CTERM sorting domain-containing protein [Acetobacteraceae bacterium]|nr:PEP-CTERM sorting domain-containing protein [Acetobacteraceae bacterium]
MSTLRNMVAALGMLAATAVSAAAAPLLAAGSTLGWSGAYQAQDSGGTGVLLGAATQIDFAPAGGGSGSVLVTVATLDLAPLFGNTGTIQDFSFSPFAPVAAFLSVPTVAPTFTLDLDSLAISTQNNSGIVLEGTATMNYAGFDATPGTYSLSFQTAGDPNVVSQYNFTFSANAAAIPEPGTLALLGAGLLGLGLARARRKAA